MQKVLAVSVLLSSQILWSQAPVWRESGADIETQRRVQEAAFDRWALASDPSKTTAAATEAAQTGEFYSKAKHFVDLWRAFAAELNEKKVFDAKLAKKVSKAFHDLEKSDGWPVGRTK
jgi:hypothetical protein